MGSRKVADHSRARAWLLSLMVPAACGSKATFESAAEAGADEAGADATTGENGGGDATVGARDALGSLEAGPAAEGSVDDSGGVCCLPSSAPACCMSFGGWAASASECPRACDGFQLPTRITKDAHGCDTWTGAAGPVCGTGADAGACVGSPCSRSSDCCPGDAGAPPLGIACGASGRCEICTTNGLNDPCLGAPPDSSQAPDCCPGLRCVDNRCVL